MFNLIKLLPLALVSLLITPLVANSQGQTIAANSSQQASCGCSTAGQGVVLSTPTGAVCTCPSEPFTAYAVTRPSLCNDFPITYRVKVPLDQDGKVFPVDQVRIISTSGQVYVQPPLCSAPR